jgi:hypothetical protein
MKKRLLFAFALSAGLALSARAQTYSPITLTGFTQDVVADGSGTVAARTSIDVDGASFALVALGYINPSNQSPTSGLPANGTINSAATSGLTYQLAPYTGNNSLRISGTGTGTLDFVTPQAADQVYVLATSGSGVSTVTITVNFSDNTSQVFTQSINDWYGGANYALRGISRVSRATNAIENSATDPRLYQTLLTLSAANTGKTIQSITFNKTSTTGTLNVMGVSIRTVASTLPSDAGIMAISAPNSGCNLTNQETITVTLKNFGTNPQSNIPVSYTINNGMPVNEIFAGPLAANSSTTYNFNTKADLSNVGNYTIMAKTTLPGDQLITNDALTKSISLSAPPVAPTVTASGPTSLCNGGSVTLTASSAGAGATYQWYNNGNPITNATSPSYPVITSGSYTVIAASNGCVGATSAATSVTVTGNPSAPTITAGGPTGFCTGGSVTLTANSATPGATFIWFQNGNVIPGATSSTYTANASGSYTATASNNACSSPVSNNTDVTVSVKPATPIISQNNFILTSSSNTNNQWYKNGAIITGATNRIYNVTANGTYTLAVITNGCASNFSAQTTITNTGIADEAATQKVVIYPNPSNGIFNLSVPENKNGKIQVTDLAGKLITAQEFTGNETKLDLQQSPKGIYLVRITTDGQSIIRRIIVE